MSIRERLSGNEAAAIAMKQINPDVVDPCISVSQND